MRTIDRHTEDPIRWLPVRVARLANKVIRWSDDYCSGDCGYPVTGRFQYKLEEYNGVQIVMLLCSTGGPCEHRVQNDPRDEIGRSYADFRPDIVKALVAAEKYAVYDDTPAVVRISFSS